MVIYTSTCVARKNGVNVTENKTAEDAFLTALALMNVQPLSPINPGSASDTIIGKGHQGVVTTHIERKTKYTVLTKSNTPNQCAKASYKD